MTDSISKVHILLEQKKFAAAEQILKDLLAQSPYNIYYLSLLAEVNLQQDKYDAAGDIIDNAIGLAPDAPHLFYIKARIGLHREQYDAAEKNLWQSIALNPNEAAYFALLAHVKLTRKKYEEALDLANKALVLDAENLIALNTRSTALLKLNRKEESFQTIQGALRQDPDNAYTHANYGWGLLEKGEHKKALQHFREALKKDPNYAYAQSGMIEALKASNPVYRIFLKYAFFMNNLTARYQWGVIIGFYLAMRALNFLADNNKALEPFLMPIIIVLTLFAFSTWIIKPVSNVFLRFNAYGKFLLSRKEKISSNIVAIDIGILATGLLLYTFLKDERYLSVAIFGLIMMVPCSAMFAPSKYKYALPVYALAMAVVGISSMALSFSTGNILNDLSYVFFFGFVAFQWVANFLMIRR